MDNLTDIASHFIQPHVILSVKPLGDGFINDTFIVRTKEGEPDYILQRKNKNVFPNIPAMVENIRKVTGHIRRKVMAEGGNPLREVMTLVPCHDGKYYYADDEGEYWTVTVFIDNTITYNKVDSPDIARGGGQGIGKFQTQLADFTEKLYDTIEGFHNIRYRFAQWDKSVAADAAGRVKSLGEELSWIESRRGEMLDFWEKVEDGTIPTHVTHNDTKISNILFDHDGKALCVIDLDTVMQSTSLNDFGDAIRSYANTGDEDDRDIDRVGLSIDIFAGFTDGYLSQRAAQLVPSEVENLAFSARYITYEQVLRFLMDYIDGDKYYKTKYPEHNLVRTHAQYKLLQSMELQYDAMRRAVSEAMDKYTRQ